MAHSRVARCHEREVSVATLESAGQPCPAVLDEVHLDAGMTASVGRQEDREQGLDHLRCSADSEHSRFTALEGACSVSERVGICQQAAAPAKQVLPLGRQLGPSSDAVEEPHPQFPLEGSDLPGESGLTDVQGDGGPGKSAGVGDGNKGTQVPKIHEWIYTILVW